MRRAEKEVCDPAEINGIIARSQVCRLGLVDGDRPYVVPMCFGYEKEAIFMHAALEGRKMDILRRNPNVCCEFEADVEIVSAAEGCRWTARYQSVIAFGKATILERAEDKAKGLAVILRHYSPAEFHFPEKAVARVAVIRVAVESMTGKRSV